MNVAQLVAEFLKSKSLTQVFCVTGGGAMYLNDAFGHDSSFRCIYNHHEQACAMAAEGYARVTGKPAVVCVTSGPGATNAITGVIGAWLDSIPMIIISGQMKTETLISSSPVPLRQLGFQEFNIIDCARHMTKYAAVVSSEDSIIEHLNKAYLEATTGRMGPVWLDIPLDIQAKRLNMPNDSRIEDYLDLGLANVSYPTVSRNQCIDIYNRIQSASRPVLLVGNEIRTTQSVGDFLTLIEYMGIPVLTEWNSHDLLPDDHYLNCGRPGTIGNRAGNFVIQQADLLIHIGCQLSIRQISYEWANFSPNSFKIGISSDLNELNKPTIKNNIKIHSSIPLAVKALIDCANNSKNTSHLNWIKWCKELTERYPIVSTNQNSSSKRTEKLSVYDFVYRLSQMLDKGDCTVLANGAACVVGLQAYVVKQKQLLFTNAGASSMGYGISASIGARLAVNEPNKVVCIEGDGSIQMNLQELQTIVHNSLNIKIAWINNQGYHSIKQTQEALFDANNRGFCGADATSGLSCPSAEKIANAYGIQYFCIDSYESLTILGQWLDSSGPAICEIISDPNEKFTPKLQSKLLEDGTFITPPLEDMYPFLPRAEIASTLFRCDE